MAQLAISLLGTFHVTLDGQPQAAFETDKARALLAFLAVEANRPHRRMVLATMLWPDYSDRAARNSLRQTLFRLRQAIADQKNPVPLLLVSVHDVQLNPAADYWLDVDQFNGLLDACQAHHPQNYTLCEACRHRLEAAIGLYQGNFLAGFSVADSPEFESWLLVKQENYHRRILEALAWLGDHCERTGDYERETVWAKREIELEPWREVAHRRLMRALALNGQRQAALHQFNTCQEILKEELGVTPVAETLSLYTAIRDGSLGNQVERKIGPAGRTGSYVSESRSFQAHHRCFSSFVGFKAELATLNTYLDAALCGQGKVVFLTGQAGSGKTALIGEFIGRAMEAHDNLLVAAGQCDARFGLGIPYQPFCEILRMFAQERSIYDWLKATSLWDVAAHNYSQRKLGVLPVFVRALVEEGRDLVGSLLSGETLVHRARDSSALDSIWQKRLEELVTRQTPMAIEFIAGKEATTSDSVALNRAILLDQVTRVLQFMSDHFPIILVLDDLQWSDLATLSLLLHLGRQLDGRRLLIIGAYRSEALAPADKSKPHYLEPVVHELQRHLGVTQIDLDRANGQDFINALVDSEPNQLDEAFRKILHRYTAGNPLFTAELLWNMQERGDLVHDEAGCWVAQRSVDWGQLPPRVEGIIAERIRRLPADCQTILAVASVQGQDFIAEVVAHALSIDTETVIQHLSSTIGKQHRLVTAQNVESINNRHLSRYRFVHTLIQQYLYQELDEVERPLFHEAIGLAMEAIYDLQVKDYALEMATHFEAAGAKDKAADLMILAGKSAYLQ